MQRPKLIPSKRALRDINVDARAVGQPVAVIAGKKAAHHSDIRGTSYKQPVSS